MCTRPLAIAAGMSAALMLWFIYLTDHGHTSPTVWTSAGTGACVVAWWYCLADWRLARGSKEGRSPKNDGDADSTVRRLGSR